jgi:hypothetical protein
MSIWAKFRRWRETERFRRQYLWHHNQAVKYQQLMKLNETARTGSDDAISRILSAEREVEKIRMEQRLYDIRYYKGQDVLDPDIHYLVVNRLF